MNDKMFEDKIKIVFFYPAYNIGGAQLLFARISEQLILNGYNVLILDFKESFIFNDLQSKKLNFEHIVVSSTEKYRTKSEEIIVLSLSYLYYFKSFIVPRDGTKFIFWDLHPFALLELTALSKLHKEFNNKWTYSVANKLEKQHLLKIKNFLSIANESKGVYFMCLRNFTTNKKLFSLEFTPNYLPIPVKMSNIDVENKKLANNESKKILNIGWISRLDLGKVEILELLLNDIARFNSDHLDTKIIVHVIGEGKQSSIINSHKKYLGENLVMAGILKNEMLSDYLAVHIDIGFAMGTSSLEFASRKIPTVLVSSPTLKRKFKRAEQRYLWLFDSIGFDVAVEEYHSNIKTLNNIIDEFRDDPYNVYAFKSFDYALSNHSFEKIFIKFEAALEETNLTFKQIQQTGIYKFTFFQKKLNSLKQMGKKALNKTK